MPNAAPGKPPDCHQIPIVPSISYRRVDTARLRAPGSINSASHAFPDRLTEQSADRSASFFIDFCENRFLMQMPFVNTHLQSNREQINFELPPKNGGLNGLTFKIIDNFPSWRS